MADITIASLTAKTTWADTDLIIVEDGADTKKMTVATLKSLLGSSGGGIIESGSNANGRYVKYSDGTLECYMQPSFAEVANTLTYREVTYPMAFYTGTPIIGNVSINSIDTEWSFGISTLALLTTASLTTCTIASKYAVSQTYTYGIHVIGRWKA